VNVLWALPLGVVIGTTLGALGAGGGILTVPVLVFVLDQDPWAATTGSLLIVGVSALAGMIPHGRAGNVAARKGLVFGLVGTAGSWPGSLISRQVDPDLLVVAFALLMLVVAGLMMSRLAVTAREPRVVQSRGIATVALTAAGIGFLTGFFGVGGGFAVVPALTLILGFPMRVAVGTSLLVIVVNSATAVAARLAAGVEGIDWPLLALFAVGAVVGSIAGGRLAARANHRLLSFGFVALLLAVAAAMLLQGVPRLLSS